MVMKQDRRRGPKLWFLDQELTPRQNGLCFEPFLSGINNQYSNPRDKEKMGYSRGKAWRIGDLSADFMKFVKLILVVHMLEMWLLTSVPFACVSAEKN